MNQWLIGFTAIISILAGLTIAILIFFLQRPSTSVAFVEPIQDLGAKCANSIITQQNGMIVKGKAYIQLAATIYDLDTGIAYYPLTESYTLAVDTGGEEQTVKDLFTWKAPELPPATYKRVLAASTYRNQEPVTTVSTFKIVKCDADGKPLLTPTPEP